MRILVCVKRVPMTGGTIVLTDDAQAIETRHLGFTISPHEECGVEEAVRLIEASGGESVVLTLGPPEAEEQLRDAMAIGIDRAIHLVTGVGAMHEGQLRGLREGDVMIAISYAPYAEETGLVARQAVERGAKLIALTDSRMSPLAADAAVALLVSESSTFGFRALTNTMALAQSLFIALAYRLELEGLPGAPR